MLWSKEKKGNIGLVFFLFCNKFNDSGCFKLISYFLREGFISMIVPLLVRFGGPLGPVTRVHCPCKSVVAGLRCTDLGLWDGEG